MASIVSRRARRTERMWDLGKASLPISYAHCAGIVRPDRQPGTREMRGEPSGRRADEGEAVSSARQAQGTP